MQVNTPLVKVIDIEGAAVIKDNLQKGDFKICLLEGKPVQVTAIVKDYQYFEFTTGYSGDYIKVFCVMQHLTFNSSFFMV